MLNIDSIPSYIFEENRGYHYVIVMRCSNNTLLYQRVCKNYKEATKRIKILNNWARNGNSFEIYSLNEIAR